MAPNRIIESAIAPTVRQQVQRAASLPAVHAAFGWFRTHEHELRDRQLELVRIPAPPFGEEARGEWLRARFAEIGLEDVHVDEVGNVFGVLPGTDPLRPLVAVTAHIDTVFPASTLLNVRREGERLLGPGISDNGAGVAGMMALAMAMKAAAVPHAAGVLFIGNVGEEGEGDLRGMRHIFSHPRWKDIIGYTVVLDGAATDTIVTQGLGSRRFEVTIHGPGGHSWSDFGMPNPIAVLARAIVKLTQTPLPADPKTTCNVGVISGGSSVNSIPERASMRVDIRSAVDENIDLVERALREAVAWSIAEAHAGVHDHGDHVSYEIRLIGNRPAAELEPGAYILQVFRAVDQHLGNSARLHRASTDANIPMSLHKEAISTGAGGSGGGAHTVHEWYDPTQRELGLKRILLAVVALAGLPASEQG